MITIYIDGKYTIFSMYMETQIVNFVIRLCNNLKISLAKALSGFPLFTSTGATTLMLLGKEFHTQAVLTVSQVL